MKIDKSGAKLSAIVKIAQRINTLSLETGNQYLPLNRGINSVCNIDLTEVIKAIDFNTNHLQAYPPATGRPDLKEAINNTYFDNKAALENISITAGSTMGLDIVFQALAVDKIHLPAYYWTTYDQIMKIRTKDSDVYRDYHELSENPARLKHSAVLISDPGNPIGDKYDDHRLLELIRLLDHNGTVVIMDSPYRRMFLDESDTFYREIMGLQNVVIIESFSKWVGLSGQRIGFVYSAHKDFLTEFNVRLAAATNGINAFAQILVQKLLTTPEGKNAVTQFKRKTVNDIQLNIRFLEENNLLAKEFYQTSTPMGIFVVVNRSEEELLTRRIGSISLANFTRDRKDEAKNAARICASFPHETFKRFFIPG
ncbi:MAG: pyridoxal phosphate-dependent aminotransferase [bacterium]|nr:pyridoxal phosphate-dependent aminotransferase [bacterium]